MAGGGTWSFQAWHRDPVDVRSDLASGAEIQFN